MKKVEPMFGIHDGHISGKRTSFASSLLNRDPSEVSWGRIFVISWAVSAVLCWPASILNAQAPAIIPIQGILTTSEGNVVNGNHNLTFHIFGNESGEGEPVFSENHLDVMFDNGYFSVHLGSGDSEDFTLEMFRQHSDPWLQVIIDSSEELTPLFRLGTVPFAGYSDHCGDSAALDGNSPDRFARLEESLGGMSCERAGHVAVWDGDSWNCSLLEAVPASDHADTCSDSEMLGGRSPSEYTLLEESIYALGSTCRGSGHVPQWDSNTETWICGKIAEGATYTDQDARDAMGTLSTDNPFHHARYTDAEAVTAMGSKEASNPLNHDRYTDVEARNAVATVGYAMQDHHHDDRYFTETELSYTGTLNDASNPMDWTKLKNVPAGFADENDNVLTKKSVEGYALGVCSESGHKHSNEYVEKSSARFDWFGSTIPDEDMSIIYIVAYTACIRLFPNRFHRLEANDVGTTTCNERCGAEECLGSLLPEGFGASPSNRWGERGCDNLRSKYCCCEPEP